MVAPCASRWCTPRKGADIDLGVIAIAKSFADPVGHYSRPDVTRLLLNREPQPTVEDFESTLSDAADDDLEDDIP